MKTIYHDAGGYIEEEFIETESMPVVFAIYEDGKDDFVRLFSNFVAAKNIVIYIREHIVVHKGGIWQHVTG